MSIILKLIKRR